MPSVELSGFYGKMGGAVRKWKGDLYFYFPNVWNIVVLNQIHSDTKCKLNKMTVQETMPIAKGS